MDENKINGLNHTMIIYDEVANVMQVESRNGFSQFTDEGIVFTLNGYMEQKARKTVSQRIKEAEARIKI